MKTLVPIALASIVLAVSCLSSPSYPREMPSPGSGRSEQLPKGMGRLVVGRPRPFGSASGVLDLGINGMRVASIGNGAYVTMLVEAGIYEAQVEWTVLGRTISAAKKVLEIIEGRTGFLEYNVNYGLSFEKALTFLPVPGIPYEHLRGAYPFYAAIYRDGSTVALGDTAYPPPRAADERAAPADAARSPMPASVEPPADWVVGARAEDFDLPRGTSVLSNNSIAVVIGNRDYRRGTSPVDFALNDAAAFRDTLVTSFGIARNDLWYLENAGLADMISLFGSEDGVKKSRVYRSASMRDSPTDLIVYYSGHGAPASSGEAKGKGFLVPVDADLLSIQSTCYAIDTLIANIGTMKGEGVVGRAWLVVDACFSGQSGDGSLLVRKVSGLAVVPALPKEAPKDGVIMLASSGGEYASWYPEKRHGLFTYFLLKGLSGDADSNGDDYIGVSELSSYLRKWVPRFANGLNAQEQTPQVLASGEIEGFLRLR